MVEKNYDPDNENCPEKDTVENLYSKMNSEKNKNTKTVEGFINDNPNRIPTKDNFEHNDSDYQEGKKQ